MGVDRENLRRLVLTMAEAAGTDLTGLARKAGLSPSTVTRFMNSEAKHLLTTRTLAKLAKASGMPAPTAQSETISKVAKIEAVRAVARVLGVDLEEAGAGGDKGHTIDRRAREWLDLIERIPSAIEHHVFEMLRGLGDATSPEEQNAGPSKGQHRIARKS